MDWGWDGWEWEWEERQIKGAGRGRTCVDGLAEVDGRGRWRRGVNRWDGKDSIARTGTKTTDDDHDERRTEGRTEGRTGACKCSIRTKQRRLLEYLTKRDHASQKPAQAPGHKKAHVIIPFPSRDDDSKPRPTVYDV